MAVLTYEQGGECALICHCDYLFFIYESILHMLSLKYVTCFIKDDLSEGGGQSQNDTGMYDVLASRVSCRH